MNYYLPVLFALLFGGIFTPVAFAHTTVEVGPYEIEAGWGTEPPVVGFRNSFVFEISESPSEGVKSGIKNAFKNLEATAKFGGATKSLDVNTETKAGHYYSNVIPTKIGSYSIVMKGEINGVPVDIEIPIEDAESTSILDFPPTSGSSSNQDVSSLKNAMSALQNDVSEVKSKLGGVDVGSDLNVGPAYDFAVFGMSLGAAGVILAVIAMIKRK